MDTKRNNLFYNVVVFMVGIIFLNALFAQQNTQDRQIKSGVWQGQTVEYWDGDIMVKLRERTAPTEILNSLPGFNAVLKRDFDRFGWAMDIAVDDDTNVFVFGWTNDYWGANRDYALVKYDSSGQQMAEISYDSGDDEFAVGMAIDAEGNIYVTGDSKSNVSLITTIKYTQEPTSIHEEAESYPKQPVLYQNYPNPFNALTRIRYYLPVAGQVSLKIYNLLGQEVATLAAREKTAGEHNVIFDASELSSGVYVYRLTWGRYAVHKKLILLK